MFKLIKLPVQIFLSLMFLIIFPIIAVTLLGMSKDFEEYKKELHNFYDGIFKEIFH